MTNERHEKALEAAVQAFYDGNDFPVGPLDRQFVTSAIAAYLQAMDAVIVPKEPTLTDIDSACLSYRHDFGLLPSLVRTSMREKAAHWHEAWTKTCRQPLHQRRVTP